MFSNNILSQLFTHISKNNIPTEDWMFFKVGDNLEKLNSNIDYPVDSYYCFFAGKSSSFSDFGRTPTLKILSDDGLTLWFVYQVAYAD